MAAIAHCPMCHTANDDRAKRCDRCGYEFGQSTDVLKGMLQAQLQTNLIAFVALLLADLVLVAAVMLLLGSVLGMFLFGVVFMAAVRQTFVAARKISVSRHSLKLIAHKPTLPKAEVHSK